MKRFDSLEIKKIYKLWHSFLPILQYCNVFIAITQPLLLLPAREHSAYCIFIILYFLRGEREGEFAVHTDIHEHTHIRIRTHNLAAL